MAFGIPLKLRYGTTAEVAAYVGKARELVVDTDLWLLHIMDGTTPGGHLVGGSGGSAPLDARLMGIHLDGTTADTGQIEAALEASVAMGRPIQFPKGVHFNVTGSRIRVPAGCHMIADPAYTRFYRNDDVARGTFEVYGAHHVIMEGVWVDYTPATYTLGYAQTALCSRNGSHHVTFRDCRVTGKMNRQIHIINSSYVWVEGKTELIGGGNAALRVVCDNAANTIIDFSDETPNLGAMSHIYIRDVIGTGASTIGGTVSTNTSYGINAVALPEAGDLITDIRFDRCVIRYTYAQCFEMGGKILGGVISDCHGAHTAGPGAVGVLIQIYDGVGPDRVSVQNNNIEYVPFGIRTKGGTYTTIRGNRVWGCGEAIYDDDAQFTSISDNTLENNQMAGLAGTAIRLTGTSYGAKVAGNLMVNNIYSILSDGSTSNGRFRDNRSYNNTYDPIYGGTGHLAENNG